MSRARGEGTGFRDSDYSFFLALVQNRTDSCRKSWPCQARTFQILLLGRSTAGSQRKASLTISDAWDEVR